METGIELIVKERWEQVYKHSYSMEHDAQHEYGELSKAAAILAVSGTDAWVEDNTDFIDVDTHKDEWGLVDHIGNDRIKALTVAGALIAAEIDRELNMKKLLSGGL